MLVLFAWFAHERWRVAATRRQELGVCTRCGERPAEPVMCTQCRTTTLRTYRLAAWFFAVLAVALVLISIRAVVVDYRTFGARAALMDVVVVLLVTAIAAGGAFAIRYFGGKAV